MLSQVLLIVFSAIFALSVSVPAVTDAPHAKISAANKANEMADLEPELIDELKDFLRLIPKSTVDEIAAKHYIVDGGFRKAAKFLRSAQFTQLLQDAQQIAEINEILDYLHLRADVLQLLNAYVQGKGNWLEVAAATCELAQLAAEPQIEFVPLKNTMDKVHQQQQAQAAEAEQNFKLQTFSNFVEELMQHLPRDSYVQMINTKKHKNVAFAEFYGRLRSAELRPMIDAAMKSKNVTGIIATLSGNAIDVKSLEEIGFKVLSWGPDAAS